jgi:hypothetical protein
VVLARDELEPIVEPRPPLAAHDVHSQVLELTPEIGTRLDRIEAVGK